MIRGLTRGAATHSQRLERWLGKDETERLSGQFRNFYYPVPVAGVPGHVYVMPGGDFAGPVEAGQEMSALDRADDVVRRHQRTTTRYRLAQMFPRQRGAFGDLNALLQARRGGKAQTIPFIKSGIVTIGLADTWYTSTVPSSGATGGAAPAGTSPTNSTTGALSFSNPVSANTSHFFDVTAQASSAGYAILCDRLFSVAKTMSSTATEAVTGTFSRYQNQTSTAGDYIGGNFLYPVTTSALGVTAHNWTVCKYTNQAGTTGQSAPSTAGVAGPGSPIIDLQYATGDRAWFMPLASGDVGVKALTQMQCSASVTGGIDFVVSHAIAVFPMPIANLSCAVDGINTAFNLVTVYDNACLNLLINFLSVGGSISLVSE